MLKAILFNDTSHNHHHGCQIVVKQIYALAAAAGIQIVRACPMRHDWRDDPQLQKDIASADLCLINGEGTLHDDARAAQVLVALDDASAGETVLALSSAMARELAWELAVVYVESRASISSRG